MASAVLLCHEHVTALPELCTSPTGSARVPRAAPLSSASCPCCGAKPEQAQCPGHWLLPTVRCPQAGSALLCSSPQVNHLRCLHEFVEAQTSYYAQCHQYMLELQQQLGR